MSEPLPPHLIEQLFDDRVPSKYASMVIGAVKYALGFSVLFSVFFILLNFPAYYARVKYLVNPPSTWTAKTASNLLAIAPRPTETLADPAPEQAPPLSEGVANNRLIIKKLNVDVPIWWSTPFQDIVPRLRDGVVHYDSTALPGQNGNVFITGHSSNFWWDKGKFNTVFATLDRLEEGDEIVATYDDRQYTYTVEKKFVVDPSHIEVLNPSDHSIITLMTCTPIGTTINRLIVQAKQVKPTPVQPPQKFGPPALPDKLPAVR